MQFNPTEQFFPQSEYVILLYRLQEGCKSWVSGIPAASLFNNYKLVSQ